MEIRRKLPIGIDDFRKLREKGFLYVDKTLMIKDFIEMQDEVALIARPRRFGKTLNMTMIREFFDITEDSGKIFEGLAIMDTEYADQMNSRPVIYLTLKDCKARTSGELLELLKKELYREYIRFEKLLKDYWESDSYEKRDFYSMIELLRSPGGHSVLMESALRDLIHVIKGYYQIAPVLLIDEYDQPIMSSYEYGYHEQMGPFLSNLYGSAMKGNSELGQALLTGVQRVAKESIFSQFNNARVYTVLHKQYAPYFGLTPTETDTLLRCYGLSLDEDVRKKYDGYRFGGLEMYNPWSILNYADTGNLDSYWIHTSSNYLVKQALKEADRKFWENFDQLIAGQEVPVWLTLETAYVERDSNYSLWGLLVNSGYLTALERIDANTVVVKVPNDEVMGEFQMLIAEISGIDGLELQQMLSCLLKKDMKGFFELYQDIVLSCTSFMDARENAYHMLFLGMCIALRGIYKVTSNLETGYGRSDIMLESQRPGIPSIIVEFKQGEEIGRLKQEALDQIMNQKYYAGLKGEVICVGLAHDKKRCEMIYEEMNL